MPNFANQAMLQPVLQHSYGGAGSASGIASTSQTRAHSAFHQQQQNQIPSTISSHYGSVNMSKEKTQQCIYCKEWRPPHLFDAHYNNCRIKHMSGATSNSKELNEEMKTIDSANNISSKKASSLLSTINSTTNNNNGAVPLGPEAKEKRLKQFK